MSFSNAQAVIHFSVHFSLCNVCMSPAIPEGLFLPEPGSLIPECALIMSQSCNAQSGFSNARINIYRPCIHDVKDIF